MNSNFNFFLSHFNSVLWRDITDVCFGFCIQVILLLFFMCELTCKLAVVHLTLFLTDAGIFTVYLLFIFVTVVFAPDHGAAMLVSPSLTCFLLFAVILPEESEDRR